MNIHPLMIVALVFGNLALGFVLGKLHERFGWNDLIRRGVLPKPHREQNNGAHFV
jgi:hypothetical protein